MATPPAHPARQRDNALSARCGEDVAMYLVAIGWLYVALMMALAEALHPQGGVLGAIVTFVLYGLLPVSILMYVMGTPLRKRARQAREAAEAASAQAASATDATAAAAAAAPTDGLPADGAQSRSQT